MAWLWVVVFLAILFIVIAFSFIRIKVYLLKVHSKEDFYVEIKALYGLVRYRYNIPKVQFEGLFKGVLIKSNDHKIEITKDKMVRLYRNAQFLFQHTARITVWVRKVFARFRLLEFRWHTQIGLQDAVHTAILSGVIWGLQSTIFGFIVKHLHRVAKPQLFVSPRYHQDLFSTEFSCVGEIRLGYAVIAGLLLAVRIMRAKGGMKAWQSILFKA